MRLQFKSVVVAPINGDIMSLSGNTQVPPQKPVQMVKPNGHTGGARERQGNDFGKESFRSKVPSEDYKDRWDLVDWGKK